MVMNRILTFPEPISGLAVRREGREKFSDEEYWAFCGANPDLRLSPEFVVEVPSLTDNLRAAKVKMEQWIANGVRLAWLIDGDAETVHIYSKSRAPRIRRHIPEIAGEGPVAGFVLNLKPIWEGL